MTISRNISRVTIAAVTAIVVAAGCGSSSTSRPDDTEAVSSIVIDGFAFSVAGDVTSTEALDATNRDGVTHTITSDTGAFDLTIKGGTTIALPELAPGVYAFHCEIHTSMRGTLTVV